MKENKTIFSKDLLWLKPFFLEANKLIPIEKVKKVKSFKVSKNKSTQTLAQCITYNGGRSFIITMETEYHALKALGNGRFKFDGYISHTPDDLLNNFAHELAHVIEWDHTVNLRYIEFKLGLLFNKLIPKYLGNRDLRSTRKVNIK